MTLQRPIRSRSRRWFSYLKVLAGSKRRRFANRHLGGMLAFVAGAVNAGGFLAVHRYTSHITGVVSAMADDLVAGSVSLVLAGAACLAAFIGGAMCTSLLINWARHRRLQGHYAIALLAEAVLLLVFGLAGANLNGVGAHLVPLTVLLLCFVMGLQNAIVTKMSGAEIRTTHMTGIATDIGIELGRLWYWERSATEAEMPRVRANRDRLKLHAIVIVLFFAGGVAGALAFGAMGFVATVPLAIALALVAVPALLTDVRRVAFLRRVQQGG